MDGTGRQNNGFTFRNQVLRSSNDLAGVGQLLLDVLQSIQLSQRVRVGDQDQQKRFALGGFSQFLDDHPFAALA